MNLSCRITRLASTYYRQHVLGFSNIKSNRPRALSTVAAIRKGIQRGKVTRHRAQNTPAITHNRLDKPGQSRSGIERAIRYEDGFRDRAAINPRRGIERQRNGQAFGSHSQKESYTQKGDKGSSSGRLRLRTGKGGPTKISRSTGLDEYYTPNTPTRSKPPRPPKKPLAVPYTTAASEFLYGTSVVKAAIRAEGRKLYNLYVYEGENRSVNEQDVAIKKLALARGVKVHVVTTPEWLSLLDRMSSGRPHNGYVLEASPLPKRPIISLSSADRDQGIFNIAPENQSREEELVNGSVNYIEYHPKGNRYPFVLMLDGILDPGNLGAIIRSAFFLGVDAVVNSTHSAPLGPVALKASAGAVEGLPLLSTRQTGAFIQRSQACGWRFYAAVAPPRSLSSSAAAESQQQHFTASNLQKTLMKHPSVLLLGGEGLGIRNDLLKKADFTVSIEGDRHGMGGVDSLNVSVAAGLLCNAFLHNPNVEDSPKYDLTNVLY